MAGGKQTPRQRMINLMYLVLTALLALQVSSSIIDKFIFLNQSLEHSLESQKEASTQALQALKEKVKKEGNSADGQRAIRRADELKKKTSKLIGEIDKIKRTLITEAGEGLDPKTGSVKNPKEETKVETYMIGREGSKNGQGYNLEKLLNGFVEDLYRDYGDLGFVKPDTKDKMAEGGPFPLLAIGNKYNPLYQNDAVQRDKDFAQANFGQTPVVAALAVLTQKQAEVIRYEQEVLKKLGAGDLSNEVKFDKVYATASADANTVARGTEYTATMFLTATSSKTDVKMFVNGSPIRVKDGIGEVKIPASGKGDQKWKGEIKIKIRGKDTTFTFNKDYTVVEPVLLVLSKSKFPLYQGCANPLETSVPALGANYNPSFGVNNGSAVPGGKSGEVTIYPRDVGALTLSVSSGGKPIGTAEFRVNPVPPPDVYLSNRQGSARINNEQPIPGNIPGLSIQAEADETFKNTLPNEANYKVSNVTVRQFRAGRAIATQTFASGAINMAQFQSKPGDGFQVKVEAVQRVNSRGEIIPVNNIRNRLISFFVN
ncbi:MAG: gliding motility protein GldM [Microscillaceae bacterium]|nr:gliding motility protein GldM [Microscillaceae bacterium]